MARKPHPITKEIAAQFQDMCRYTWQAICIDMPEDTDNEQALECCFDANYAESYCPKHIDVAGLKEMFHHLTLEHGYTFILLGLSKHIRLC